jgi:hypothetical protein
VLAGAILLLPAPALLPALVSPGGVCAVAADAFHAALVVGTGSQTLRFCVALDATSVSGIHLIELAHTQDGLQYRLGFGGLAVCQLANVGPTGNDCFGGYPSYWGLWLGDGSGGWTWSGSGAGSVRIHDGDTEGWTWGTGDSGATHPAPPPTTIASVCGVSPSPSATPPPTVTPTPGPGGSPPPRRPSPSPGAHPTSSGSPSPPGTGGARPSSTHAPRASRSPAAATATGSPTVTAAAASGTGGTSGGPPVGALLAIAGIVALGGAGFLRVRVRPRHAGPPTSGDGSQGGSS